MKALRAMATTLCGLAVGAVVFTMGMWIGVSNGPEPLPEYPEPYCPTEDSCVVDYDDGHWYVLEVTP